MTTEVEKVLGVNDSASRIRKYVVSNETLLEDIVKAVKEIQNLITYYTVERDANAKEQELLVDDEYHDGYYTGLAEAYSDSIHEMSCIMDSLKGIRQG